MLTEKEARSAAKKIVRRKHLLGLEEMSKEEILLILQTAASFKEIFTRTLKKVPTLRG